MRSITAYLLTVTLLTAATTVIRCSWTPTSIAACAAIAIVALLQFRADVMAGLIWYPGPVTR